MMNTDRERKAMEMALEALEAVNEMSKPPMGIPLPAEIDGAMEALRQALDHVPDTMKMLEPDMGIDRGAWDDVPDATKWVDELRGGDETEQEPVAWRWENNGSDNWIRKYTYLDNGAPDEPELCEALYTAPPSKPWESLSDEEIHKDEKIMVANIGYGATFETLRELVKAIETALRSKNNG